MFKAGSSQRKLDLVWGQLPASSIQQGEIPGLGRISWSVEQGIALLQPEGDGSNGVYVTTNGRIDLDVSPVNYATPVEQFRASTRPMPEQQHSR